MDPNPHLMGLVLDLDCMTIEVCILNWIPFSTEVRKRGMTLQQCVVGYGSLFMLLQMV